MVMGDWIWLGEGVRGTGIPAECIIERWVAENVRWPASFAAAKRRDTREERVSESPNCMVGVVRRRCRSWR